MRTFKLGDLIGSPSLGIGRPVIYRWVPISIILEAFQGIPWEGKRVGKYEFRALDIQEPEILLKVSLVVFD